VIEATRIAAPAIRGVGVLATWWNDGDTALAETPLPAAAGFVPVPTPALAGDRFRRLTRECLLAVAAVQCAVARAHMPASDLAGPRTGVLYVSATSHAAANRQFLEEERSTTLHFPYTAPSAVPGEVAIEFGIRGPFVVLTGGATTTLEAVWIAAGWLARGLADRVVLLSVEAVREVVDLFLRARPLYRRPLLEGAACVILEPGGREPLVWASASAGGGGAAGDLVPAVLEAVLGRRRPAYLASAATGPAAARAEARAISLRGGACARRRYSPGGEALACGPLVGLAQAVTTGERTCLLTASWRNDYGALWWPLRDRHVDG
jgi:hypothetical protein